MTLPLSRRLPRLVTALAVTASLAVLPGVSPAAAMASPCI